MATREGIYVAGHEIVQRYVGNRLVWEKAKWIYKTETRIRSTSAYENNITIVFSSVLYENSYNLLALNILDGYRAGAGSDNKVIEVIVKEWHRALGGYDGARLATASGVVLTCKSKQDAATLHNILNNTGILKIYNKR